MGSRENTEALPLCYETMEGSLLGDTGNLGAGAPQVTGFPEPPQPLQDDPSRRLSAVAAAGSGEGNLEVHAVLRTAATGFPSPESVAASVEPADACRADASAGITPGPQSHMVPIPEQDAEDEEGMLSGYGTEAVAQAIAIEHRIGGVLQFVQLIPSLIQESDTAPTT